MNGHPDLLDIDAVRSGHGRADDALHVRGCAQCRETLRDLEALAADLKQGLTAQADLQIPEEVDRRILWQARKRALATRRDGWRRPGWAAAAAAAIVCIGLVSILRLGAGRQGDNQELAARSAAAPAARAAASDVDGDGRVDILDAFALARAVDAQRGSTDVNADGLVDRRDVDLLAARAVSLGGA